MEAKPEPQTDALSRAAAKIPSCTLVAEGLQGQRERGVRLSRTVVNIKRERVALVIDFAPDLDRQALYELIATERECCPFLGLDWNPRMRRLTVSVARRKDEPALEAIAFALRPNR